MRDPNPMQGDADISEDLQNRAALLQKLAKNHAVLICMHPQLFLVRLIFGLYGMTGTKPRLLLSSIKDAQSNWTKDEPWLVITSEHLQDGNGLDLIRWTKKQSPNLKAVLLLNQEHATSQSEALAAGADAIVMEESIEKRTGALLKALDEVLKGYHYVDPNYQDVEETLSQRQREILGLVATGLGNKEIAEQLQIAPTTARDHVQAIMRRLNVNSRAAAAVMGLKLGLINTPMPTQHDI